MTGLAIKAAAASAYAFAAPVTQGVVFDPADPMAAVVKSLQTRLDACQLRLAALEARVAALGDGVAAVVDFVPFGDQLYAWVRRLAAAVADEWGTSATELLGKARPTALIRPRYVLIWSVHKVAADHSYPQLGRLFGVDHTTIIYDCRRVEKWRAAEEDFRHLTDQLVAIGCRLRSQQVAALQEQAADIIAAEGGAE